MKARTVIGTTFRKMRWTPEVRGAAGQRAEGRGRGCAACVCAPPIHFSLLRFCGPPRSPPPAQEDELLRKLVGEYPYATLGANGVDWKAVAAQTGRTTKQCRERFINVLDPAIIHTKWTERELETLFRAHAELGNRWSAIAQRIPGRSGPSSSPLTPLRPPLCPPRWVPRPLPAHHSLFPSGLKPL